MKRVFKSILFFVILFILVEAIAWALLPQENIKKFGMKKVSSYEILNEKLDTIDAIFMGDSLIYTSISPLDIWNEYGFTSYSYASAAQIITTTYDNMKVAIESQHPKIIMMEANVLYRDAKNAPSYSKYNMMKVVDEILPIATHHNNWKKVLFKFVDKKTEYSAINDFKGFKYITDIKSAKNKDYMKVTEKVVDPVSQNIVTLKKIKNLCNDNNIKFVLISTPNFKSWNYGKYLGTKKISEDLDIEFIDLNLDNPLNIDWQTETKDKGSHLNYEGAKKVTSYIGKYLYDTNILIDHRDDSDYKDWDLAYNRYERVLHTN